MTPDKSPGIVDAIVRLAEEIGRASPESADKALKIIDLAKELAGGPDPMAIQDALDTELVASDVSDLGTKNAAAAIAKELKP
jgi:hypothetical protein